MEELQEEPVEVAPVAGTPEQTLGPAPSEPPHTPDATTWIAAGSLTLALAIGGAVLWRRIVSRPTGPAMLVADAVEPLSNAEPAPKARLDPQSTSPWSAALSRTASAFRNLFGRPVDEALLTELEEALLVADVGVSTTALLMDRVRRASKVGDLEPDALRHVLRVEMRRLLGEGSRRIEPSEARPWVILVVGVNGSGKTTTIGKLAARLTGEGKRVLLAAADTYRAAASEQLAVWAERARADLVRHGEGADPGAVAFDALQSAVAKGHDVVIIDTAGRLQTRKPLMEQLAKIRRVIAKVVPDGPHDTLLVVDGTMGQNAVSQARLFHEATPLTGVVITKLDGTAKGGMVLALTAELGLPVRLVGLGERITDLSDFDPDAFVTSIA